MGGEVFVMKLQLRQVSVTYLECIFLATYLNPLWLSWKNYFNLAKILILKQKGIMEQISYERRVYESVDDRSLSFIYIYI